MKITVIGAAGGEVSGSAFGEPAMVENVNRGKLFAKGVDFCHDSVSRLVFAGCCTS